jgi:hypothetical protein
MLQKIPFLLAALGIVGGVFISILFGANEEMFKNAIKDGLTRNIKIQEMTDPDAKAATLKSEVDKNWRYYQRFHFHATGIGTMSLSLLIFLSFVGAASKARLTAAWATSVGGFLYPFVWLFAGIYGPEMGRHAAKEAFAFFGYMGGIFLLGSLAILILAVINPIKLTHFSKNKSAV